MAAEHLTVLSSQKFPQAFEDAIDFEVRRVSRIVELAQLGQCDFEDEHCDCRQKATVHHLESQLEFCSQHFNSIDKES
jgi:hypothetical protein